MKVTKILLSVTVISALFVSMGIGEVPKKDAPPKKVAEEVVQSIAFKKGPTETALPKPVKEATSVVDGTVGEKTALSKQVSNDVAMQPGKPQAAVQAVNLIKEFAQKAQTVPKSIQDSPVIVRSLTDTKEQEEKAKKEKDQEEQSKKQQEEQEAQSKKQQEEQEAQSKKQREEQEAQKQLLVAIEKREAAEKRVKEEIIPGVKQDPNLIKKLNQMLNDAIGAEAQLRVKLMESVAPGYKEEIGKKEGPIKKSEVDILMLEEDFKAAASRGTPVTEGVARGYAEKTLAYRIQLQDIIDAINLKISGTKDEAVKKTLELLRAPHEISLQKSQAAMFDKTTGQIQELTKTLAAQEEGLKSRQSKKNKTESDKLYIDRMRDLIQSTKSQIKTQRASAKRIIDATKVALAQREKSLKASQSKVKKLDKMVEDRSMEVAKQASLSKEISSLQEMINPKKP